MLNSKLNMKNIKPAPGNWDPAFFSAKKRPSAVLILLIEQAQGDWPRIVMIRRSSRVSSHKGQIGFPGGRFEDIDRSPSETALREANEEINVDPAHVQILGTLPALQAIDSSFVFPIVGSILAQDYFPNPNLEEVQSIHEISADKLNSLNCRKFSFNMFGCWRESFLYDCGDISVWGLSAEILAKANF